MTKLVLFGDPDSTQDAEDIYAAFIQEENVDLFINGGDNGYNKEFEPVKTLVDKHFPPGSEIRKKLKILLGNHDHEESEGSKAEAFFGAMFPELYKTQPGFEEGDSSWENPKWLWDEHLNDELAFIGMNSQDEDIGFKRNQYNWVVSRINHYKELRKQNKCRWILAGVHKPWVTKKSSHSAYTNHREVYGDVFFNVVNAMFYDHNHNDHVFRSWKPINKEGNAAIEIVEELLPDGKTIDHSKTHGMTGNINGHSGHEHNKFKEAMDVPEILWYNDSVYSYIVVETNDKLLNIKYKDKDRKVLFEYNISDTTDYSNGTQPPPDPVDECLDSNKCIDQQTGECRQINPNEFKDPNTKKCMPTGPPPDMKEPHCDPGYKLQVVDGKCMCVKTPPDPDPDPTQCKKNWYWNTELNPPRCVPKLIPDDDTAPLGVDARLQKPLIEAAEGETVEINGEGSLGAIEAWTLEQDTADTTKVELIETPGKKYTKSFKMPNTEETLDFILTVRNNTSNTMDTDRTQVRKKLTAPPPGEVIDAFGMKILLPITQTKPIPMEKGSDHRNGQRYNVNHKLENHWMQGYFKLGDGQTKHQTKEDGPNHGSCDFFTDQICFWLELGIYLEDGKGNSSYEWHHADNFDLDQSVNDLVDALGALKAGNWIGFGTGAYWNKDDGLRHYEMWGNKTPFKEDGTPNNEGWKKLIHLRHTADLIKEPEPIKIPRDISKIIGYDKGFECEIRCHGATNGDTDMKNCFVYEVDAPKKFT